MNDETHPRDSLALPLAVVASVCLVWLLLSAAMGEFGSTAQAVVGGVCIALIVFVVVRHAIGQGRKFLGALFEPVNRAKETVAVPTEKAATPSRLSHALDLEARVDRMRDQESEVNDLFERGVVNAEDAMLAKSLRLQAEVQWIREQTGNPGRCS